MAAKQTHFSGDIQITEAQRTSQQKQQVELAGIKGHTLNAEWCNTHGIVQRQYYKWRDLLLNGADRLFVTDPDKEKEREKTVNQGVLK